jgi:lactoylglutathione lyase
VSTVRGLFETHLTVADVPRSSAFYRDVVGLPVALELPERGAAFHWIGRPGQAMLGLWSIGSAPIGMQLHVAFDVALEDVLAAPAALRAQGVEPLSFFAEPADEPSVIGWMPAAAVYLRDPDGHLLEYLAMLDGPPRPELGIRPWSESGIDAASAATRIEPYTGPRAALRPLFELAEDSAAELDGYLGAGDVLVARAGDRIVGHVQVVGDAAEIKSLAVEGEHRRRGIGRQLVEAALALGGARTVRVATAATDIDNLRFYQRLGFRMSSIERDAFSAERGYDANVRDRVWLDLDVPA